MRFIQLAAIAITIIVAFPIGIGYMMAFDETEVSGWESTDTANLSDLILNHETEYYATSTAPGNNSELIYNDLLGGESTIVAPDYVTVGSTVTSLPTYTQQNTTITKPTATTNSYTGTTSPFIISVASGRVPADPAQYGVVTVTSTQYAEYSNSNTIWGFYDMAFYADGDALVATNGSLSFALDSSVQFATDRVPNTYTVTSIPWQQISIDGDWSTAIGSGSLKIVAASTSYVKIDSATEIIRLGSVLFVGGTVYNGVSAVYFSGTQDLIVSQTVLDAGSYAQPSDGWRVPELSAAYTADWVNGQRNSSVTMYAAIPADTFATFTIGDNVVTVSRSATGVVTFSPGNDADTYTLGNYSNIQVVFGMDSVTISGITVWPTMYVEPVRINTLTADYPAPLQDPFLLINIADESNMVYRVDSATIVAGTFPSTYDYTLDMVTYWPGSSYALDFSNVGIFGDSITFGGRSYDITNGMITYDTANGSATKRLIDVTFSATYDNGVWTYSINNYPQVPETAEARSVFFGGEWSATLMGYKMESYTETVTEWVPGEFGIDSDSFIVVGLFGCLATFVGLGFYGAKTGHKVLSLMIICGICAVVLILMA